MPCRTIFTRLRRTGRGHYCKQPQQCPHISAGQYNTMVQQHHRRPSREGWLGAIADASTATHGYAGCSKGLSNALKPPVYGVVETGVEFVYHAVRVVQEHVDC